MVVGTDKLDRTASPWSDLHPTLENLQNQTNNDMILANMVPPYYDSAGPLQPPNRQYQESAKQVHSGGPE